jgi:hypothetical protein
MRRAVGRIDVANHRLWRAAHIELTDSEFDVRGAEMRGIGSARKGQLDDLIVIRCRWRRRTWS